MRLLHYKQILYELICIISFDFCRCVLALDEVADPQNLGALLRSSYFFGVSQVVICSKNSSPLSPVASKASSGAMEAVGINQVRNMMRFLEKSAENGWEILGTSLDSNSVDIRHLEVRKPVILVLGNEGHGLRTLVQRQCHRFLRITGKNAFSDNSLVSSTQDEVDSLNVSVSGGVLLHHLVHMQPTLDAMESSDSVVDK